MFPLDFPQIARTTQIFDGANVPVLEADCATADFTGTGLFEEETRSGRGETPFSLFYRDLLVKTGT